MLDLLICHFIATPLPYEHNSDLNKKSCFTFPNSIIYRDIKPNNIGFDVRGDLKLFDFGLSRELRDIDKTEGGMYKLTGCTGSRRYMAPEVALCKVRRANTSKLIC